MEQPVRVLHALESDLALDATTDRAIDVNFAGQRVFSFWSLRDTSGLGSRRSMPWPQALSKYLQGYADVQVCDHVGGEVLFEGRVQFGTATAEIAIKDGRGNPLGLDKSGRLMRLFASRDADQLAPLLDAIEVVLTAMHAAGIQGFLAYGTLLGAVREGTFIGHDSDADLGYVSKHGHPADAISESFELQRSLQQQGFTIRRYSGIAFKVIVRESDGTKRGLDVFGGFMFNDHLYLMGEVGHPFQWSWLEPYGFASLAGREFPVPAQPEHLLEAMYGPSWRVPDPAYKFTTPRETVRRLSGWFRGTRIGLDEAHARRVTSPRGDALTGAAAVEGSLLARTAYAENAVGTTFIDIGCGAGQDVLWLAKQGLASLGLDYVPQAYARAARLAARGELPARFEWFNLNEFRVVASSIAKLSRESGTRVVLARHLVDATDRFGVSMLLTLARQVTKGGGRLYLQFYVSRGPALGPQGLHPVSEERIRSQVLASRGTVERCEIGPSESGDERICTMVVSWQG